MTLAIGETWDGTRLTAWNNQSAPADAAGPRAVEVTDGTEHLRLRALDRDVKPLTPNDNPRAQLVSPTLIEQGATYRVAVDLLIPGTALPTLIDRKAGHWAEFIQFANGAPYAGSPPLRIMTQDAQTFGLRLADQSTYPWRVPMERNVWWRLACEFRQATDGWFRLLASKGSKSTPAEVVAKTPYATVQASNDAGPNALMLDAYMQRGTAAQIGSIFFRRASITRLA